MPTQHFFQGDLGRNTASGLQPSKPCPAGQLQTGLGMSDDTVDWLRMAQSVRNEQSKAYIA